MTSPAVVSEALTWWAAFYADHHAVSVTVRFFHLAGLLFGGGTALLADRQLLEGVRMPRRARRRWLSPVDPIASSCPRSR